MSGYIWTAAMSFLFEMEKGLKIGIPVIMRTISATIKSIIINAAIATTL